MFDLDLRRPRAGWCGVLLALLALWCTPMASADPQPDCRAARVPVTVPGVPGARLYGELCTPDGPGTPSAVQLLVHGATYDHSYWDWPLDPDRYSYVRGAVDAGYATFNVDRLGAGRSTRPLSAQVTLANGARALHGVVARLRRGAIGGRAFARVVWVGHSFGSQYAWVYASQYDDVDAFVLTGQLHSVKPSWIATALTGNYPALLDPKFRNRPWALDLGYLTSVPGARGGLFYHAPTADPAVVALDERLKDTIAGAELATGLPLVASPPPASAPSRRIAVPTLLVLGARDNLACGAGVLGLLGGLNCTAASVRAQEAPYYTPAARLDVQVVGNTGHDLQLHRTAPQTTERVLEWVAGAIG